MDITSLCCAAAPDDEQVGERLYDHRFEWYCQLQKQGRTISEAEFKKGMRTKVGACRWTKGDAAVPWVGPDGLGGAQC